MERSEKVIGKKVSIIVPVFNEAENIGACLKGIASAMRGISHEVLVVYDFDEDTTVPAVMALGREAGEARLFKNTIGRGAANALKAGFAGSTGDVIVTTMADLSDPPDVIPAMSEKVRGGAAVVSGSRYMEGGSQSGGPLLKRTLSRIAGLSLHYLTGLGTHDATTNFRAYSAEFARGVDIESDQGFQIALELTVKAHVAGLRVDEVPSSWTDRSAGTSRFRLFKWLPGYFRWYMLAIKGTFIGKRALDRK